MVGSRASVASWLWNHNPFYVISALLMLFGVRQSYGGIAIGTIDCWVMMGILAAYTLTLATVGVLIVRWGKVWDDARSILLLLLLLFLAVSVSADDLFVKMESSQGGAILLVSGFSFSVAVLLAVLSATRIRLKLVYVVPLTLYLALFYVAPWWCSPELHPKNSVALDWTLLLFPQIAAVLNLTLFPAVRMQRMSVKDNGTPWPWPVFPWSAFVILAIAVVLRSYALTMTYSPSGPIWKSGDERSGIVFDSIWRPYFLIPFALSVFLLILEAGLVSGNRRLIQTALRFPPILMFFALPFGQAEAMRLFLMSLVQTLGSPVWICVWLLVGFYGWAVFRQAERAEWGLFASMLAMSVVGPKTIDVATLTPINSVPLFVVGAVLGFLGLMRCSSLRTLVSLGLLTTGLWHYLPSTPLSAIREPICFHLVLAVCLLLSILWHDRLSKRLQFVGAMLLMSSSLIVLHGPMAMSVSWSSRCAYGVGMFVVCLLCALYSRSRTYWTGFVGMIGIVSSAIAVEGYRSATSMLGRQAMAAFSWSIGTLIIGVLISAQKARWLPEIGWYGWLGFTRPQLAGESDSTAIALVESPANPEPTD
jgi:hypothetical protein